MTEIEQRLTEATDELRAARVELHEERRWRRWSFGVMGVFAVFLAVVLFAPGWGLVSVANENRENGDILVECTTAPPPGDRHECYERGQRSTAEALEAIDRNDACRLQEAVNQTLDRLGADIGHIQIIEPSKCFKEPE